MELAKCALVLGWHESKEKSSKLEHALERVLKEKGMEKVKQSMEFLVILCLCEYLPSDSVLICFIWIIPSKSW